MAFRKRPADGEAGDNFQATVATGTVRDPTMNGRRPESVNPASPNSATGTQFRGERQWNRGQRDSQGSDHDW